jgi:hypothetical protein
MYAIAPRTVTVTTTATLISDSNPNWAARLFKNMGAASIYLGASNVTAAGALQGWELGAGLEFPDTLSNGPIYAIIAAATADVKVWEVKL